MTDREQESGTTSVEQREDFFTTSNPFAGGRSIDMREGFSKTELKRGNPELDKIAPFLARKEEWDNYCNQDLYEFEKNLRAFIERMKDDPSWHTHVTARTYMFSDIFRAVVLREYDHKKDAKFNIPMSRIIRYYCSRVINNYYDYRTGKCTSKKGYTLSWKRLKQPPMSLKLRMEWLLSQGEIPTFANMKLIEDDLKPGHSRYPKTEANMQRRKKEAQERFNVYQKERNARIKQEQLEQSRLQ